MKKPVSTKPEMPPQRDRPPPQYAGDMRKLCSNCQHFKADGPALRQGDCHNGISGRLQTRAIDACAYGFYPDITRFPLKAGPGGIR